MALYVSLAVFGVGLVVLLVGSVVKIAGMIPPAPDEEPR
jgi:hypothetical protein